MGLSMSEGNLFAEGICTCMFRFVLHALHRCETVVASGTIVTALGKKWHSSCFVCAACSCVLEAKMFLFVVFWIVTRVFRLISEVVASPIASSMLCKLARRPPLPHLFPRIPPFLLLLLRAKRRRKPDLRRCGRGGRCRIRLLWRSRFPLWSPLSRLPPLPPSSSLSLNRPPPLPPSRSSRHSRRPGLRRKRAEMRVSSRLGPRLRRRPRNRQERLRLLRRSQRVTSRSPSRLDPRRFAPFAPRFGFNGQIG